MSGIPVVEHHPPTVSSEEVRRAERLAERLVREQPRLESPAALRPLMPDRLEDRPTLHLDDLGDIRLLDRFYDVRYLEDRARLRAGDGDFVASCSGRDEAFEACCSRDLGLGEVTWLHPVPQRSPLRVASACWTDRTVRHALVHAIRSDDLFYIHPHAGNHLVWSIASLFSRHSHRPLEVIAPPPALARRVNHKLWFAEVVSRLFGPELIPRTASAWNFAALASVVREMARQARSIVLKLPDSAGGAGNLVLPAERVRDQRLGSIRRDLKEAVRSVGWRGETRLLVGSWESAVLAAPSAQVWIPPEAQGSPIVEGLYEQHLEGVTGYFTGSRPARLPPDLASEITDRCWLLAHSTSAWAISAAARSTPSWSVTRRGRPGSSSSSVTAAGAEPRCP